MTTWLTSVLFSLPSIITVNENMITYPPNIFQTSKKMVWKLTSLKLLAVKTMMVMSSLPVSLALRSIRCCSKLRLFSSATSNSKPIPPASTFTASSGTLNR